MCTVTRPSPIGILRNVCSLLLDVSKTVASCVNIRKLQSILAEYQFCSFEMRRLFYFVLSCFVSLFQVERLRNGSEM